MTKSSSDNMADAVAAAQASTVRIEAGRCGRQTGIVFASDLVITSQRALRAADNIAVFDAAGARREAELVGSDAGLDLALLRTQGDPLPVPIFAPHAELRVGQLVFALGRPGAAIRASLRTLGLLSEEFRTHAGGKLDRYIESDRGLPEGFEGGPLVDDQGRVIGMNSSSLQRGADLSVPHASLARSVQELLAHGRMRRGYLGVSSQPVRLPAALRDTLSQRSGALVLETDEQGPAHAAGLALGDVIVALDATPIRGPRELAAALRDKHGQEVSLRIVRAGQLETRTLKIAERGAHA
jgi:S1-C subfamily serine protease